MSSHRKRRRERGERREGKSEWREGRRERGEKGRGVGGRKEEREGGEGELYLHLSVNKFILISSPPSCVLTTTHIICLQLTRLDLYYAELSTGTSFSLNMLPSKTLQAASSSSDSSQISLVPLASPLTVWIKLSPSSYHLIRLSGEVEPAVLVSELEAGLPLIGWLDGDRTRPMDLVVRKDTEGASLRIEITGEGAEKVEAVVDMEMDRGPPVYGDVKLYTKSDSTVGFSIAMVMEDFTVIMLKPKGKKTLNLSPMGMVWVEPVATTKFLGYPHSRHQREFCTEGLLGRHALGMLGRTLRFIQ